MHGQSQSITPLTTAHLYAFFHKALSFHVFIQRYRSINQKGAKRSNYDECGADAPFSLIAMKDFLWNSTSAEWAVASPYQKRWRCVSVIMNHIPSSLTMGCDPLLRSSWHPASEDNFLTSPSIGQIQQMQTAEDMLVYSVPSKAHPPPPHPPPNAYTVVSLQRSSNLNCPYIWYKCRLKNRNHCSHHCGNGHNLKGMSNIMYVCFNHRLILKLQGSTALASLQFDIKRL